MPALRIREAHQRGHIDPAAYKRKLDELLGNLDRISIEADREVIELFSDIRRDVVERIAALGDSPSGDLYRRTLAGIDDSMTRLAQRWGIRFEALQERGFQLGEEIALGPLDAAGVDIPLGAAGVTTDAARVIATIRQDLVQGATEELRKRIRMEVAGVATGAQTAFEASRKIGRNLTDRNHFSTLMHRARAIVVTEVGRAQALATQGAQERAVELVPELRKRWINAHLPGARETHLETEARYAPNGIIGPIPIDATYAVAGNDALYPHDPSLPASESVNCHCVSITVIADSELDDPGTVLSDADQERLDTQPEPELTPRERRRQENEERLGRLAKPLTKPAGWEKWTNAKKLKWVEAQMEADFPLGEEFQDEWVKRGKRNETIGGRTFRRPFSERIPTAGKGADLPTVFDFKAMDPEAAFVTSNEMRRLGARYPEVAERLNYVGSYRNPAKADRWKWRKTGGPQWSGEYAHASRDGYRIGLNPKFYGDHDNLLLSVRRDARTAWHPEGYGSIESVTTHEWGHQVDNWLRRNGNRDLVGMGTIRADGSGTLDKFTSRLKEAIFGAQSDISNYAKKSQEEAFAELFMVKELRPVIDGPDFKAPTAQRALDLMDDFLDGLRELGRLEDVDILPTERLRLFTQLGPADRVAFDTKRNELIDQLGFGNILTKYDPNVHLQ